MLVLRYFHKLGFAPISLAALFLLYEFYGLEACLGGAALMLALAAGISVRLARD